MRDHWYIAADARDLKDKPLARRILGEQIVLFRGDGGQPAALVDRCPHRNVQLSGGKVCKGKIQCPYHGWEFDTAGKCQYIPSLVGTEAIPSTARATTYAVREQDGFVWVYMGAEPGVQPPAGSDPFKFPHRDDPAWGNARLAGDFPNSVSNVVENFIDCSHTGYVHGGLFRQPASHSAITKVRMVPDGVIIDIDEQHDQADSFLQRLLVPKGTKVTHQDRFILPSIVRVHYTFGPTREIIGFQVCTPVDEFETRVYVYLTWRLSFLTHLVTPFMPRIGKVVLDQDMDVLVSQGSVIKQHGEKFVSCPADTANLWIRAVRERASRGEPPLEREKEVEFRL